MPGRWVTEGQFEWTDGSPVDFVRWGTGQPSNQQHGDAGAQGEDGVVLTFVTDASQTGSDGFPEGWWNDDYDSRDAHDEARTNSGDCDTCEGNWPLCQTSLPTDDDVNRQASRFWTVEATSNRFVAIGRVMPQTSANAYCVSRGWTLASIHSSSDQRHAVHACSQMAVAGARPGTPHAWTTDVMADDAEWVQDADGTWVLHQTILKEASGYGPGCWIGLSDSEEMRPLSDSEQAEQTGDAVGSPIQSTGSYRWSDGTNVDVSAPPRSSCRSTLRLKRFFVRGAVRCVDVRRANRRLGWRLDGGR